MDLNFTPEELEFRAQIRDWVADNLPQDISHKVHNALRLTRDDFQRWAKILGKKGWHGWGWPKEFGGPGMECDPAPPVRRGMRARRRAARDAVRPGDGGAGDHGLRLARAAQAPPARHHERRGVVEPGLQRAGLRLGPRVAEDQGRAQGRLLHRQRPEGLDDDGPARRLDLLPGAHQQRRQAANRHQLPADRHEEPRHHGAPDHHDGRRARGQRGVLRQRRGAGRQPGRRREQGLDLREVPARARAHQHRRREPQQARARAAQAHREGRRRLRRHALSRRDREARGRDRRARDDGAARAVRRKERQAKPRRRRPAEDPRQRDPAALHRADDAGRRPVRGAVHPRGDGSRLAGRLCRRRTRAPLAGTYFNMRKTTIYGGSNEVQSNIVAQTVLGS